MALFKKKDTKASFAEPKDAPETPVAGTKSADTTDEAAFSREEPLTEEEIAELAELEQESFVKDAENEMTEKTDTSDMKYVIVDKRGKPLVRFFTCLLTIIISVGVGVCSTYFYFDNRYHGAKSAVVWEATEEVLRYLSDVIVYPDDLTVFEAYIQDNSRFYNVIMFGTVRSDVGQFTNSAFHVEIEKDSGYAELMDDVEFDADVYARLKEGSAQDKIQAGVIKSRYESYMRSLDEIRGGFNGWTRVSDAYVNLRLVETGNNWRKAVLENKLAQKAKKAKADAAKEEASAADAAKEEKEKLDALEAESE